ncbi:MAG: hypothetical protein KGJ06_04690, partial [Pseudomonadota bacterium]|nr:hypothetical protein [Pseudomonadota bacterium]
NSLFNNAVHVTDLTAFVRQCAQHPENGHRVFVLGAASAMSFNDLLHYMKTHVPSGSPLVEQKAEKPSFTIDSRRAQAAGYAPMTLEQMLQTFIREQAS